MPRHGARKFSSGQSLCDELVNGCKNKIGRPCVDFLFVQELPCGGEGGGRQLEAILDGPDLQAALLELLADTGGGMKVFARGAGAGIGPFKRPEE